MNQIAYETVARFSMIASLFLFIGLFILVLAYVFRYANRDRLEVAQREALDLAPASKTNGGQS